MLPDRGLRPTRRSQDENRAAEVSGAAGSSTTSTAEREALEGVWKNHLEEAFPPLHGHVFRVCG